MEQEAKEINFFFVSTIWRTDDDKSLQQTEEEGFYMMDEQTFFWACSLSGALDGLNRTE